MSKTIYQFSGLQKAASLGKAVNTTGKKIKFSDKDSLLSHLSSVKGTTTATTGKGSGKISGKDFYSTLTSKTEKVTTSSKPSNKGITDVVSVTKADKIDTSGKTTKMEPVDLEGFDRLEDDELISYLDNGDEDKLVVDTTESISAPTTGTGTAISTTTAIGTTIPTATATAADLKISYTDLESNINTIKKVVEQLKNAWTTETKKNLAKIENSWVGNDCKEYITKLNSMDKKVVNTIAALELLCSTYENARDMIKQNQATAMKQIANIN